MEANQTKAEFLCFKIPEFRRCPPWASQTNLLIDDICEELDEMQPLWEEVLPPDFDVERDTPITVSQATQLCRAVAKRCVDIKCFLLWETHWLLKQEFRESGVRPRDYWTYWGVGRASDWAYWGVRQ
ncbi:uncharacterized protein HD556DRAFT_1302884 [Suillus plorans]|uniref:Uncharacterized protein n=1 Tax=Suillus plorans TaxID=116603 RepID=A0A9P7DYC0_9AGAM|nr:uncharacterized protein HD556DRAFT_1302884 [Suillus plorans]KAG1806397.1 hypothetical protein HD556DRAFT_1302884 [Suillus plorans]